MQGGLEGRAARARAVGGRERKGALRTEGALQVACDVCLPPPTPHTPRPPTPPARPPPAASPRCASTRPRCAGAWPRGGATCWPSAVRCWATPGTSLASQVRGSPSPVTPQSSQAPLMSMAARQRDGWDWQPAHSGVATQRALHASDAGPSQRRRSRSAGRAAGILALHAPQSRSQPATSRPSTHPSTTPQNWRAATSCRRAAPAAAAHAFGGATLQTTSARTLDGQVALPPVGEPPTASWRGLSTGLACRLSRRRLRPPRKNLKPKAWLFEIRYSETICQFSAGPSIT